MVRLIPSSVFVKDPFDVWGKEHTIGNAELAARLGSSITFDRRGTVFFYEDFENAPLSWYTGSTTPGGGAGHSVTLANDSPFRGAGCLKIVMPDKSGDDAYAYRTVGGKMSGKIGGGCVFRVMPYVVAAPHPAIKLVIITGTTTIIAGIKTSETMLYIWDATNAWVAYAALKNDADGSHYPIKFVVDIDNMKYVRCVCGEDEIDLSLGVPYSAVGGGAAQVRPYLYGINTNDGNGNPIAYFDDLILTNEEPA